MARQFTHIKDDVLSRGIDAHDTVDQIPQGYVENAENVLLEGKALKRREGFEVVGGDIPLRVEQIDYRGVDNKIDLTFPDYVDFSSLGDTTGQYIRLDGETRYYDVNAQYQFDNEIFTVWEVTANNKITITASSIFSSSINYTTTSCDLIVSGILSSSLPTKPFINHLDVIQSTGQVVAGRDGSLVRLSQDTTSLHYSDLMTIDGDQIVGPLFYENIPSASERRTSGFIHSTTINNGIAPIKSVVYNGTSGQVKVSLNVPSFACYDGSGNVTTLSAILKTTYRVDLSGISNSKFNGKFEIVSVSSLDLDTIDIVVSNSLITNTMWDMSEAYGYCGIFSDSILFTATHSVVTGDTIYLDSSIGYYVNILSSQSTELYLIVDDASSIETLSSGSTLGITGDRSEISGSSLSSHIFVSGDSVVVGDVATQITSATSTSLSFRDSIELRDGISTITRPYIWNAVLPINISSAAIAYNDWTRVCWSSELRLFCTVSASGTGNRVMTSPDGVNWTPRTSAADNIWRSVCWSPELNLFCAVSSSGTGNRVMTSPNGVVWTSRASAADITWLSVCWSPDLSLFCAVAFDGVGNGIMTSPDGITWTSRTPPTNNQWSGVCWSSELTLFCAISDSGTGDRVMTSPDGINWTSRTSAADNNWRSICWSSELGLFCAVSTSGTGDRVMTSPDGINWTSRTSAADNQWYDVCWSSELGLFCAVAITGTNRVMVSTDGVTWIGRYSSSNNWVGVCWSPELSLFCSVASSGVGNRIRTSPDSITWTARDSSVNNIWLGEKYLSSTNLEKSVNVENSIIFSNNVKFNGTTWEYIDIRDTQGHVAIQIDETSSSKIEVSSNEITIDTTATVAANEQTIPVPAGSVTDLDSFAVGNVVLLRDDTNNKVYSDNTLTIKSIDTSTPSVTIYPGLPAAATIGGTFSLASYVELNYYLRLYYENGNTILSGPSIGYNTLKVRLTKSASVHIKFIRPNRENYNLDNNSYRMQLFRSVSGGSYFRIIDKLLNLDIGDFDKYVYTLNFLDFIPLYEFLYEDKIPLPIPGDIGSTRSSALVSENITSIDNQVVKSNLTGKPQIILDFTEELQASDLTGKTWVIGERVFQETTTELTFVSALTSTSSQVKITVAANSYVTTGDVVYICKDNENCINSSTRLLGWFYVTAYSSTYITIATDSGEAITASDTSDLRIFCSTAHGKIPIVSDYTLYNINGSVFPFTSLRTAFPAHLASAISIVSSMTQDVYSITSARGGRDLIDGRCLIYTDSIEIPPDIPGLYVNGELNDVSEYTNIDGITPTYPSRSIMSLKNFPYIYQDVYAESLTNLPTVQDITPEDGDEITATVPFFAVSAFGGATQSNVLVIFKHRNAYIMDVTAKYSGSSEYLKQISLGGSGCDSPGSVVVLDIGVFYAGRSGIYLLDRSFKPIYIGKNLERFWEREVVDRDYLTRCTAGRYVNARRYQLSVPVIDGDGYTDKVFVFKTPLSDGAELETSGWTSFGDEMNAAVWASGLTATYFASGVEGQVCVLKETGEYTDFSDKGAEIESTITFRPMDFGMPAVKKFLKDITIFMTSKYGLTADDFEIELAVNLSNRFDELDEALLSGSEHLTIDGIGDEYLNKINFVTYSSGTQRGNYFQVRITARGVNKDLIISQVSYQVAAMNQRGTPLAIQTIDASSSTTDGE